MNVCAPTPSSPSPYCIANTASSSREATPVLSNTLVRWCLTASSLSARHRQRLLWIGDVADDDDARFSLEQLAQPLAYDEVLARQQHGDRGRVVCLSRVVCDSHGYSNGAEHPMCALPRGNAALTTAF